MPNALARSATSLPMRPRPTMPSVLSASSTPSQRLRSQRPAIERGVGLGHVAGLRQQQRHRVLGGRDDVALRRVDHHDAATGGRRRRRRCRGRCRPGRRPQLGAGLEHLGGDLRGRADDRARARRRTWSSSLRQVELDVDLVAGGAEPIEAAVGDLFGDQDACHRVPSLPAAGPVAKPAEQFVHPVGQVRTRRLRRSWRARSDGASSGGSSAVGVPHFIDDYAATTDIWTRSLPVLLSPTWPVACNALDLHEWTLAAQPRRGGGRDRGAAGRLGADQRWPVAARCSGRPACWARPSWPRSSSARPCPSVLFGQWGDAVQSVIEGAARAGRHLPRHQLRACSR